MTTDAYVASVPAQAAPPRTDLAVVHGVSSTWTSEYSRNVRLLDVGAAIVATGTAAVLVQGPLVRSLVLGVVLVVAWIGGLALAQAYDARIFGSGAEEYRRVAQLAVAVVALAAVIAYLTPLQLRPEMVVPDIALAAGISLAGRYALRQRLHRRRAEGECMRRVVVVGHPGAVEDMATTLSREAHYGLKVVCAVLPTAGQRPALLDAGVPVLGGFHRVLEAAQLSGADVVAVLSAPELSGVTLRRLAWSLEGTSCDLVVSPGLVEVAGPRLSIAPVAGLPLLHVERPEFTGIKRVLKASFDRCLATLALLALSPLLIGLAIAVRVTSAGPAIFRQARVGKHGEPFTMLKFRSMATDAEDRLLELAPDSDGNGMLFKMRRDPRVTRVGALMRRYSLDELPQLINVVRGDMSLVGPRPPLSEEVAMYEDDTVRRLLVMPGLTGLWQVSGRSDLSWEDSVRLDLRYVDNWSLTTDLAILWKTARAVLRGSGAY